VNVDAIDFFTAMIDVLWVALAVAVGVAVLAATWIAARAISTRLEDRFLPRVARWSRRRAGLAEDAGPWACPACHSVNASTVEACYRCGLARADDARELLEAHADETVFHPPEQPSRFDPSMYRGPGVQPLDGGPRPGGQGGAEPAVTPTAIAPAAPAPRVEP
jgi:hypothetical protein